MATHQEFLQLAERCEKATGPDREIDFAIGLLSGVYQLAEPICGERIEGDTTVYVTYMHPVYNSQWHGPINSCVPKLTASLDAITALIERELPGWHWHASTHMRKGVSAINDGSNDWAWITADTPALALCAAFCRAMADHATATKDAAA